MKNLKYNARAGEKTKDEIRKKIAAMWNDGFYTKVAESNACVVWHQWEMGKIQLAHRSNFGESTTREIEKSKHLMRMVIDRTHILWS